MLLLTTPTVQATVGCGVVETSYLYAQSLEVLPREFTAGQYRRTRSDWYRWKWVGRGDKIGREWPQAILCCEILPGSSGAPSNSWHTVLWQSPGLQERNAQDGFSVYIRCRMSS